MSGAAVYEAAAQGMSLDCLALVVRRACVLGSLGTVAIKERVLGRLPAHPLPDHYMNSRQKHTPILSVKVYLSLCINLRQASDCGTYQVASRAVLKEYRLWTQSWCCLSALLQLNGIYQKRA